MTAASNGPTAPWKLTVTPPPPAPPAPVVPAEPVPPANDPPAPPAPARALCGDAGPAQRVGRLKARLRHAGERVNSRSVPVVSVGAASTGTIQENFAASPV